MNLRFFLPLGSMRAFLRRAACRNCDAFHLAPGRQVREARILRPLDGWDEGDRVLSLETWRTMDREVSSCPTRMARGEGGWPHTHGEGRRRLAPHAWRGEKAAGQKERAEPVRLRPWGIGRWMSLVIRCLSNSLESICSHLGVSFIPAGILA